MRHLSSVRAINSIPYSLTRIHQVSAVVYMSGNMAARIRGRSIRSLRMRGKPEISPRHKLYELEILCHYLLFFLTTQVGSHTMSLLSWTGRNDSGEDLEKR